MAYVLVMSSTLSSIHLSLQLNQVNKAVPLLVAGGGGGLGIGRYLDEDVQQAKGIVIERGDVSGQVELDSDSLSAGPGGDFKHTTTRNCVTHAKNKTLLQVAGVHGTTLRWTRATERHCWRVRAEERRAIRPSPSTETEPSVAVRRRRSRLDKHDFWHLTTQNVTFSHNALVSLVHRRWILSVGRRRRRLFRWQFDAQLHDQLLIKSERFLD
jgi:hypothetical protein